MKDIFLSLLIKLRHHGKITDAMFNDGFAKITFADGKNEYSVSVIKREKTEEEKND